jgi:prepilin-type N-terminal cleavage/methylation domain-containing protein
MNLFNINYRQDERGFTLVELLIALSITSIVLALTGSGLYTLMRANQSSQTETMDRLELEQALAFMTDEIKMSQQVMINIPTPPTAIPGFQPASGSSRVQPILVLNPAPNSRLTNPIVYYLADPPNSSVWLGPRVIYRWGPTFLQNGNYSDGSGVDVLQLPQGALVNYYNEVVVDRMSDRQISPIDWDFMLASHPIENLSNYGCINKPIHQQELNRLML